jgi:hypothetical protein
VTKPHSRYFDETIGEDRKYGRRAKGGDGNLGEQMPPVCDRAGKDINSDAEDREMAKVNRVGAIAPIKGNPVL